MVPDFVHDCQCWFLIVFVMEFFFFLHEDTSWLNGFGIVLGPRDNDLLVGFGELLDVLVEVLTLLS